MSGGHWQYLQHRLNDAAMHTAESIQLLGAIEHTLDWGISGDTCHDCAKIQVIEMLESFFDGMSGNQYDVTWQDVLNKNESRCDKCKEQDATRGT